MEWLTYLLERLKSGTTSEVIFPNSHLSNLEFLKFSQEKHSSLYTPQMVLSIAQWCMIPHKGINYHCLLLLSTSKEGNVILLDGNKICGV